MAADLSGSAAALGPSRNSLPPGFAGGPFIDSLADEPDMDEAGQRSLMVGAPLSPSATSLLPSNIFADDEPPSQSSYRQRIGLFAPRKTASPNNDPQSPASSSRSMSIFPSPQGSSHNLPFPQFPGDASDRRSLKGSLSSPIAPPGQSPASGKLSNLFQFQRSRGAKPSEDGSPVLGSLKQGQSHSFPRQTDDTDPTSKGRRISLSWNVFGRNPVGPGTQDEPMPPAAKGGFSAKTLLQFGSRGAGGILDRDPSSPRPASIASSDMPRPSTESASIWGPVGDGAHVLSKQSRLWLPDNTWSRNPSRRPSIHGSPSALKTNLASAEDEILDEEALLNPEVSPSQVGVIGGQLPAAKRSLTKSLNPTAPTFHAMTSLFRAKADRDKDGGKERDKPKAKEKDKSKDKGKDKGRSKEAASETMTPTPGIAVEEAPSESRMSRDGLSVHTQTSVSESRESLSLDHSVSNTPSEPNSGILAGVRDPDNAFRKLFRKDSTSKLSLSQRMRRGKGAGSVANSERNISAERSSIGDSEDLNEEGGARIDSATSSPSLGPSKTKDKTESRLKSSGSWFSIKKKAKEKESLEIDRGRVSETETPTPTPADED